MGDGGFDVFLFGTCENRHNVDKVLALNPRALARAKSYVAENAEDSDEVDAHELGREVFADEPVLRAARW